MGDFDLRGARPLLGQSALGSFTRRLLLGCVGADELRRFYGRQGLDRGEIPSGVLSTLLPPGDLRAGIARLAVPEHLTKFVGSSLRLEQVFTFGVAEPDGTVNGAVKGSVPGMPVDIDAVAVLRPVAATTEAEFTGELRVRIPLVGKKVEAQVEPFVRDAFAGLERRAADWLTR